MKLQTILAAALCSSACAVSTQAESTARVWLREHSGDNPDELAELKTENPDAYALVKALLTKRSLGLLDPKHPTASFSAPPPKDDSEDQPSGAAVYAKFATTPKEQLALTGQQSAPSNVPYPEATAAAVPYPEAQSGGQNWMNWKPDSNDDDAMVQNVLGAVADLTKGKSLRGKPAADDENPIQAEAAKMEDQQETAPVPSTTQAAAEPEQVPQSVEEQTAAPAKAEPAPAATPDVPKNALTAFSFDDSAPTTTTTTLAPAANKSPLASWLGLVKPHVVQAAAAPQEKPSNPYLMDLQ
jgi:hypothetical protein